MGAKTIWGLTHNVPTAGHAEKPLIGSYRLALRWIGSWDKTPRRYSAIIGIALVLKGVLWLASGRLF